MLVLFATGASLSPPSKAYVQRVAAGAIRVGDCPLLS
jgi:hypothetical protein